jgi:ABC-type glutathione transport system ATPase component
MSWWKRRTEVQPGPDTTNFPLIRLNGVGRVFEGDADEPAVALRDVTVDIGRGEYVSVSGPSGCGKSTLLSIVALLDTPVLARGPQREPVGGRRAGSNAQRRHRADFSEL